MNRKSFAALLIELQRRQLQHDEIAHRDLLALLLPRRLTHFTLHLAKYQARLLAGLRSGDEPLSRTVIADSLIIGLAAANGMNLNLSEQLIRKSDSGRATSPDREIGAARSNLILEYVEVVGRMAKACEALDHVENFPSRAVLEQSTVAIVDLILRLAQIEQIDLTQTVAQRWAEVEAKAFPCRGDDARTDVAPNSFSAVA